jgi:hypothetical protein
VVLLNGPDISGLDGFDILPACRDEFISLAVCLLQVMPRIKSSTSRLHSGLFLLKLLCKHPWATLPALLAWGAWYGYETQIARPQMAYRGVPEALDWTQPATWFRVLRNEPLTQYLVTVDKAEELTGLDFFAALPDSVEQRVEAVADSGPWRLREVADRPARY